MTEGLSSTILHLVCFVPARALLRLLLRTHSFRNYVWFDQNQNETFQLKESLRVCGSGVVLLAGVEKDAVGVLSQPWMAVGLHSSVLPSLP